MVKLCVRWQPSLPTLPAEQFLVTVPPQLSSKATCPLASSQVGAVGLQPRLIALDGQEVIVGAVLSIAIVWASFFVSGLKAIPLLSVTRVGGFGGSDPVLRK